MYFASRTQAGRMLANRLLPKYRYENCAVVALSDGGVIVGAQIATSLHCVLSLLLSEEITLPRELEAVAGISQNGAVSFNSSYSPGEIDELIGENYQYIEQEKLTKIHDLNHLLGHGSTVDKRLLEGRNIILVSDGLSSGFAIDLAVSFLKPVRTEKLIVTTPLASIQAVDRLHVTADEIFCLSVVENYISTDHYYDQNDVPPHDKIIEIIERIIMNWK
ncbi:MAG: phosphoribosyltransferase [Candidatus Saccharimonadales bacterium]